MSLEKPGYQFGDVTEMVVAWMGPASRAVRGKIDWLKFGKAIVAGVLTTGTLTFATGFATFLGSVLDPEWATGIPALVGVAVYAIEQVRRILQGQPAEVPPYNPVPEDPRG